MNIHIKNIRTDTPTEGAIGFHCGRNMPRKLQLHGVRDAKLGNPHPFGRTCPRCHTVHNRVGCIEACAVDREWVDRLADWIIETMPTIRHRREVDLWCWCAPDACHCELIRTEMDHWVRNHQ